MENKLLRGDLLSLSTQRNIAKIGAGVSLGLVTLTAFTMKNKLGRALHIASGAALVSFSLYHYGLYNDGIFQRMLTKHAKNRRQKESQALAEAKKFDSIANSKAKEKITPKRRKRRTTAQATA